MHLLDFFLSSITYIHHKTPKLAKILLEFYRDNSSKIQIKNSTYDESILIENFAITLTAFSR